MRKNWRSILKFVYRQLDVLKSFKCFKCFQDLSPAMCGLFYQDKNAHHHTVALAYHWLTRTRKHSALRYNIDKTLLDYQINQLSMILYSK